MGFRANLPIILISIGIGITFLIFISVILYLFYTDSSRHNIINKYFIPIFLIMVMIVLFIVMAYLIYRKMKRIMVPTMVNTVIFTNDDIQKGDEISSSIINRSSPKRSLNPPITPIINRSSSKTRLDSPILDPRMLDSPVIKEKRSTSPILELKNISSSSSPVVISGPAPKLSKNSAPRLSIATSNPKIPIKDDDSFIDETKIKFFDQNASSSTLPYPNGKRNNLIPEDIRKIKASAQKARIENTKDLYGRDIGNPVLVEIRDSEDFSRQSSPARERVSESGSDLDTSTEVSDSDLDTSTEVSDSKILDTSAEAEVNIQE